MEEDLPGMVGVYILVYMPRYPRWPYYPVIHSPGTPSWVHLGPPAGVPHRCCRTGRDSLAALTHRVVKTDIQARGTYRPCVLLSPVSLLGDVRDDAGNSPTMGPQPGETGTTMKTVSSHPSPVSLLDDTSVRARIINFVQ